MTKGHFLRKAAGAVAGLLICGVWQVLAENSVSVNPVTSLNLMTSLNPMTAVDRATLKGFLERPLFNPARRLPAQAPIVVATPSVAAPSPELPPTLQLLGVIHGSRDMAVARRAGDEKTIILHTGDQVSGWTVAILPPIGLRLQNGRRAFIYTLFSKLGDVRPVVADPNADSTGPVSGSGEMAARSARSQKRTY